MSILERLLRTHSDQEILEQMAQDGIDIKKLMSLPSGVLDMELANLKLTQDQYRAVENVHFQVNQGKE